MSKSLPSKPTSYRLIPSYLCALDETKSEMRLQAARQTLKRLCEDGAEEVLLRGEGEMPSILKLIWQKMIEKARKKKQASFKKAILSGR